MRAVARDRALELAAVAKVHGHARSRPLRAPVQHERIAQETRHLGVGIERHPEEAAVGARQILIEAAQQAQRQDGLAVFARRCRGLVEIGILVQARYVRVALRGHGIDEERQGLALGAVGKRVIASEQRIERGRALGAQHGHGRG